MVSWLAKLDNGLEYCGETEDGSWKDFAKLLRLQLPESRIVNLSISLDGVGGATIDPNRDGYYLNNKVIANLNTGDQMNFVGIGYWSKDKAVVRIKWYNSKTMQLVKTEARPDDSCGLSLIQNPSNTK